MQVRVEGGDGDDSEDEVQVRVEGHFGLLAGRNMSSEGRLSNITFTSFKKLLEILSCSN